MHFINRTFSFALRTIFGIFLVAAFASVGSAAQAAWDGNPYAPGATLDPECSPTQANCQVVSATTLQEVTTQGATTDKKIQFAGATTTASLLPNATNGYDLGSYDYSWRSIYVSGTAQLANVSTTLLTIGGQEVCLLDGTNCPAGGVGTLQQVTSNGHVTTLPIETAGLVTSGNIIPTTNNAVDLGSPSTSFANVYASGTAFVGSISVGTSSFGNFSGYQTASLFEVPDGSTWNMVFTNRQYAGGYGMYVYDHGEFALEDVNTGYDIFVHYPTAFGGRGAGTYFAHDVLPHERTESLGNADYKWKSLFVSGNAQLPYVSSTQITIGGMDVCLEDGTNCVADADTLQSVTARGSVTTLPIQTAGLILSGGIKLSTNNTYDLGAVTSSLRNLYASGTSMMASVSSSRLTAGVGVNENFKIVSTTTFPNTLNDIVVQGNYAYINTWGSGNIYIMDISNPRSPTRVSTTTLPGGYSWGIDVSGNYLYVPRSQGGLYVYDVSNKYAPTLVGSSSCGGAACQLTNVRVSGRYAYAADYQNGYLYIMDVADPTNPVKLSSILIHAVGIYHLEVSGNFVYIGDSSNMVVVNVADPNNPKVVGSALIGDAASTWINDLQVNDKFVFVGRNDGRINTIDVSNPSLPVTVATSTVLANTAILNLDLSGDYLYVTDAAGYLYKVNATDPTNMVVAGRVAVDTTVNVLKGVSVQGNWAYTVKFNYDFNVVELSGAEFSNMFAHVGQVGSLHVSEGAYFTGDLNANAGLIVGGGGILSQGALAISATNTTSTFTFAVSSSIAEVSSRLTVGPNTLFVSGTSIGVGTAVPDQGKIEVKGGTVCVDTDSDGNATSCIASESDQRLKENVAVLEGAMGKIMQLRPVTFDWKTEDAEVLKHYPLIGRFADNRHSLGLIAQEAQVVLPEAIENETVGDAEVQYLQLDYTKFVPLLIKGLQEQQGQIEELRGASQILAGGNELTVSEPLKLKTSLQLVNDNAGRAKILTGAKTVEIKFSAEMAELPVVTVTPMNRIHAPYWVTNVTRSGFFIEISDVQIEPVVFGWHAFAVEDGKEFASDGTVSEIEPEIVAAPTPEPEVAGTTTDTAGTVTTETGSDSSPSGSNESTLSSETSQTDPLPTP